mmetsp:Transcript_27326/g.63706  ORF Transcript_27326/g.63706 Transcript_27326/m.63706 type:complete len:213 (-) Transcript_27326:30-668(-)
MSGDALNHRIGQAVIVIVLDQRQQVLAHDFKDHAFMSAVGSSVPEMCLKLRNMARLARRTVRQLLQQGYLVDGLLCHCLFGLTHLHGHKLRRSSWLRGCLLIGAKPDCGEGPSSQLAQHAIAGIVKLVQRHGMVSTTLVVAGIILVGAARFTAAALFLVFGTALSIISGCFCWRRRRSSPLSLVACASWLWLEWRHETCTAFFCHTPTYYLQ